MKKTLAIIVTAAFALAACGNKNKNNTNGPSNKTDTKAGAMGGATYGTPAPTTGTATPPPTTATPNPCGAGM